MNIYNIKLCLTIFKSVDNSTKTISDGVLGLVQSVLVRALDQDGDTPRVLAVFNKSVLIFSLNH